MAGVCVAATAAVLSTLAPRENIKEEAFLRLEKIRDEKKREVLHYLERIERLVKKIEDDPLMLRSFHAMIRDGYVPNREEEYELDKHFIQIYGDFYDILFVRADGYVFHSIRQESDYHTHLFDGGLSESKFVRRMKENPGLAFSEYEYYPPSDEPAAFFVTSVRKGDRHLGWFVLQSAINRINTLLTDRSALGRTGEVYLVNEDKMMLTDSRFIEDSTILRLKVDTQAVREGLEKAAGRRVIRDYRGVKVLSAFERFDVMGATWVILSEIDENEVITDHYLRHAAYYEKRIRRYSPRGGSEKSTRLVPGGRETKRVDLNEFARALPGTLLETSGVSSCTALSVVYPERFAYLVHITPTDKIYLTGRLTQFILGDQKSDFLSELFDRIRRFDVYPYELRELRFTIVASHDSSLRNAVRRILELGVDLDQITLVYEPGADYANVLVDPADGSVRVVWGRAGLTHIVHAADLETLGAIVKKLSGYGR